MIYLLEEVHEQLRVLVVEARGGLVGEDYIGVVGEVPVCGRVRVRRFYAVTTQARTFDQSCSPPQCLRGFTARDNLLLNDGKINVSI